MMQKDAGNRTELGYEALLLVTAAIWGTAFVAQRQGMASLGPLSYNAARFTLGALALVPLLVFMRVDRSMVRAALLPGVAAGAVLTVGATLQQMGLMYTTAGKAGFITGLYVVLVPVAAIFFGRRTPVMTWVGAALALSGLYLLSVSGSIALNAGDVYVFVSAFFWTAHILVLDRYASRVHAITLACVQFAVCAILGWGGVLLFEAPVAADFVAAAWPIAYGGIMSIGVAYTLQAVAQSRAHPARASIIMSLEAPFAAVSGALLLGETMGVRELAGAALMLAGMILAQYRK